MNALFADKHAQVETDLDAILSGDIIIESSEVLAKADKKLIEAITSEQELISKLVPISEVDIFSFMKRLKGGTFFNMGLYTAIPVARAYKKTFRIYKVVNMTAIVSGVNYENVGTTKDFRDQTGKAPGKAFYNHVPGLENKVGTLKSNPNSKYILWDVKASSGNWVAYYLVDISTGAVKPVSVVDLEKSTYLTPTEKDKLKPKQVTGYDTNTGALVSNETVWRTTKFEHVFWLSQSDFELGTKFQESLNANDSTEELSEATSEVAFRDLHANIKTDLDALLSGEVVESIEKPLEEVTEAKELKMATFDDEEYAITYRVNSWPAGTTTTIELSADSEEAALDTFWNWVLDPESYDSGEDILNEDDFEVIKVEASTMYEESYKNKKLKESYRRTVSRGASLIDNDLFVDFD